jgi:hypothetical protein
LHCQRRTSNGSSSSSGSRSGCSSSTSGTTGQSQWHATRSRQQQWQRWQQWTGGSWLGSACLIVSHLSPCGYSSRLGDSAGALRGLYIRGCWLP